MSLLYHAYVYLEFLILACTIYILAPMKLKKDNGELFSPTYLKPIHNQLSAILNHAVNMYGLKDKVA